MCHASLSDIIVIIHPSSLDLFFLPPAHCPLESCPCYLALRISNTTFEPFLIPSLLENSNPARDSHHEINSVVSINVPLSTVSTLAVLVVSWELGIELEALVPVPVPTMGSAMGSEEETCSFRMDDE